MIGFIMQTTCWGKIIFSQSNCGSFRSSICFQYYNQQGSIIWFSSSLCIISLRSVGRFDKHNCVESPQKRHSWFAETIIFTRDSLFIWNTKKMILILFLLCFILLRSFCNRWVFSSAGWPVSLTDAKGVKIDIFGLHLTQFWKKEKIWFT